MIKSFLGSLLHFMDGLADPNMLVFVLKQTQEWPHYFGPFQSQGKAFLKVCVAFFLPSFAKKCVASSESVEQLR